jgi:selenocysteine lyase/cysteine desulfurase
MHQIEAYEHQLTARLVDSLQTVPGLRIYGITDPARLEGRLSTVSFTLEGRLPRAVAEQLARDGIYVWDGNFYALAVTERLELEGRGGLIRVGLVHYNTEDEIDRLTASLNALS